MRSRVREQVSEEVPHGFLGNLDDVFITSRRTEVEMDIADVEEWISELLDEIAVLEELLCSDCPPSQDLLTLESQIARKRLIIVGQERLLQELLDRS